MTALPAGTVTFLFTDIEGSTHLLQQLGDVYADVLDAHNQLLDESFTRHDGIIFGSQGDALFAVFADPVDAVAAALDAQQALRAHPWGDAEVRVRMGIHTGDAVVRNGTYIGLDVHRAARICSAAHGGQVLLSETTATQTLDMLPSAADLEDRGVHRLKDLPKPDRLFELTHPDFAVRRERLRHDAAPGNLPKQVTTFVGRKAEVARSADLLASGCSLLTLVGPGGCGKTRLALEVAVEVVDSYPDGAWLIELGHLAEADLVGQAVAGGLDVRDEPGRDKHESLIAYLTTRRLLLILDNCEHLVDACAQLVTTILRSCPGVQVLATSQEALAVGGETVLQVPPLPLPAPGLAVGEVAAAESVQLFADRAAARTPNFVISAENASDVAHICRRLEGIPLAIELAAARINVLTPAQIAARLDDQFRLLTGGDRAALPRQRTLRAAVDWSHDLLSEEERVLLRRLSVFAGGWTIEAAEAICSDGGLLGEDVLDLLGRLAARSLVVVEEQDGAARYRLLEPIRQYATERLIEAAEAADLRSRHLQWFWELALRAEPELTGPNQAAWLTRLAAEADNLRAGMEWSASHPAGSDALLTLATALWRFWLVRGHWTEGRSWLSRALAVNPTERTTLRARALAAAGDLATEVGDYQVARRLLDASLELWHELAVPEGIAKVLNHLGNLARMRYEADTARSLLVEALALRRSVGNERGVAVSLRNLGLLAAQERDFETARSLYEEALPLARHCGDKRVVATLTQALATVAFSDGDWDGGRRLAEEALTMSRQLGDRQGVAEALTVLSGVSAAEGDSAAAASLLEEAQAAWRPLGSKDAVAWSHTVLGEMALSSGDYQAACMHLDIALNEWRAIADHAVLAQLTRLRGWAAYLVGDLDAATPLLEQAVDLARSSDDDAQLSVALHNLADLVRTTGDLGHATRLYEQSLELAQTTGWKRLLWWPLHGLGVVARLRGDHETAVDLLRRSLAIRPKLGRAAGTAACLEELGLVACDLNQWDAAARVMGHADGLRRECRVPIPPVRRDELTTARAAAAAALGQTSFDVAWKSAESASADELATEIDASGGDQLPHTRETLE